MDLEACNLRKDSSLVVESQMERDWHKEVFIKKEHSDQREMPEMWDLRG